MNSVNSLLETQESESVGLISVVLPVYQDARAVGELLDRLFVALESRDCEVEVVIVDDGSDANVWAELKQVKNGLHNKKITLIRLASNHGQGLATLCGIQHSKGQIIVTIDADLQHPPEEVPALIRALKEGDFDLVYGVGFAGHGLIKRLTWRISRVLSAIMDTFFFDCTAFRVMTGGVRHQLICSISSKNLSPDDIFRGMIDKVGSVAVRHERRKYGKTSYSFIRMAAYVLKGLYFSNLLKEVAIKAGVVCLTASLLSAAVGDVLMTRSAALIWMGLSGIIMLVGYLVHKSHKPISLLEQLDIAERVD